MYTITHMAKLVYQTRPCRTHDSYQQMERREARPFNRLPFNAYSQRFH